MEDEKNKWNKQGLYVVCIRERVDQNVRNVTFIGIKPRFLTFISSFHEMVVRSPFFGLGRNTETYSFFFTEEIGVNIDKSSDAVTKSKSRENF